MWYNLATASGAVEIYDGDTLVQLGRLLAPLPSAGATTVPDPDQDRAYVVWNGAAGGSWRSRIVLYRTANFTAMAQADLGNDTAPRRHGDGPAPAARDEPCFLSDRDHGDAAVDQ